MVTNINQQNEQNKNKALEVICIRIDTQFYNVEVYGFLASIYEKI